MSTRYSYNKVTWIDVVKPTQEEIDALAKEFEFDVKITKELPTTIERSKLHTYGDYVYLVLQFPTLANVDRGGKKLEVDFVISDKFLLTVHYEPIPALETLVESFKECSTAEGICTFDTPDDIVYRVISALYHSVGKELEIIEREIHLVEEKIFSGKRRQTVEHISETNHRLLDFKKTIRFHKDTLERLQAICETNLPKLVPLMKLLRAEQEKLWNVLEHNKEILEDLKKTNDSLLTYQTNEVIKFLAVLNFTAVPIATIPAWLLLVDSNYIPTSANSVIQVVLICLVMSVSIYLFLRRKWFY